MTLFTANALYELFRSYSIYPDHLKWDQLSASAQNDLDRMARAVNSAWHTQRDQLVKETEQSLRTEEARLTGSQIGIIAVAVVNEIAARLVRDNDDPY